VQSLETFQWRFPGIDVRDYGGKIYKEDMNYVLSSTAACDDHARACESMLVDSDDESYSVSSPSYSAYDSEEGDLEMLEDFIDSSEHFYEDEMDIDFETTLQIY
jgi:hypothetical protein